LGNKSILTAAASKIVGSLMRIVFAYGPDYPSIRKLLKEINPCKSEGSQGNGNISV
jgi:hypothetical protein